MDTLSPKLIRRMFIASTLMLIIAVALSAFNVATVLSAPERKLTTVPQTVGFEGFLSGVSGPHTLTFAVYDVATGTPSLWSEIKSGVQVTNGLYSVSLGTSDPAGFVAALTPATIGNVERWIGVSVDGGPEISPRTKVSSVPFALNADNANRVGGGATAGMIALFDTTVCPAGWHEYAAAQGRYVVGVPVNGQALDTVGQALSDEENRPVGQHTHTLTDPGHGHGILTYNSQNGGPQQWSGDPTGWGGAPAFLQASPNTTGITINNAGAVANTNAPYIQLRYCQLNP